MVTARGQQEACVLPLAGCACEGAPCKASQGPTWQPADAGCRCCVIALPAHAFLFTPLPAASCLRTPSRSASIEAGWMEEEEGTLRQPVPSPLVVMGQQTQALQPSRALTTCAGGAP